MRRGASKNHSSQHRTSQEKEDISEKDGQGFEGHISWFEKRV